MPGDIPLYIADGPVPRDYVVPNSGELLPLQVEGTIDGTAAASSFYAVLQVLDPNGRSMGKYISSAIAAGASADVTWFPRVAQQAASVTPSSGLAILYDSGYIGSSQTSIDTGAGAIPSTYTALLIYTRLRSTYSGGGGRETFFATVRFNGDTGLNYDYHDLLIRQTTVPTQSSQGDASITGLVETISTDNAGRFGNGFMFVPFYAGPSEPILLGMSWSPSQTEGRLISGEWHGGGAAINRISIQDNLGGSMAAGSRLVVCGI